MAIARALVHDPPLIVADEPTAHLDYVQVEEVLQLLREIADAGPAGGRGHPRRPLPPARRPRDRPHSARGGRGGRGATGVARSRARCCSSQGDDPDLVYVVESGTIEVYRERADGSEEHRATFGPGEYFGELGPMLSMPRSASARAREPATLIGYGPQAFRARRAEQRG